MRLVGKDEQPSELKPSGEFSINWLNVNIVEAIKEGGTRVYFSDGRTVAIERSLKDCQTILNSLSRGRT